MTLPVVAVKQPASIKDVPTAKIVKEVHLTKVFFPGVGNSYMHAAMARCWFALVVACIAATKQTLTAVSTADVYRSFQVQHNAFFNRYTPTWSLEVNGLTNRFANTRTYNGVKYYLRKGQIPCAVPGTGWHPRGLAIDVAIFVPTISDGNQWPGGATYIRGNKQVFDWLKANVLSFGFSWENVKEYVDDPHLHYFAGDAIPQRVIDIENYLNAQKAA